MIKYIIASTVLCLALITGVYINQNGTGNVIADMSTKCEYNDKVNHRSLPGQKIVNPQALKACEAAINKVQASNKWQVYASNGIYWAEAVK
jgi:hypothetical protein